MFFGRGEREQLLELFDELLEPLSGISRLEYFLDKLQEGFRMSGSFQASHGARGFPLFQAGSLLRMNEQGMVQQQTQGHSSDRPVFAWLLGQVCPSFVELPVLEENFYKPPQGVALDDVLRTPGHIARHQIAVFGFILVSDRNHEAFPAMRLNHQASAAHPHVQGFTPPHTNPLKGARVLLHIGLHAHLPASEYHELVGMQLADGLRALGLRAGSVHESPGAEKSISKHGLDDEIGVVCAKLFDQREGHLGLAWIVRIECRGLRPIRRLDARL